MIYGILNYKFNKTASIVLMSCILVLQLSIFYMIQETFTSMTKEITTMEEKISEIKNGTLQSEMEEEVVYEYIVNRYSRTPSEIAKIISKEIVKCAYKTNTNTALLVGIIETESGFNPYARSNKGAIGLMQIMPKYWVKELKDVKRSQDLWNISLNIESGLKVLKHYLKENNGNLKKALTAYNGGGKNFHSDIYEAIGHFSIFRGDFYEKRVRNKEVWVQKTLVSS